MKLKTIAYLLFFIELLYSCDPSQTIEFENKTNSIATLTFYFSGETNYRFQNFETEDSLKISLEPQQSILYNFGIGTWEINNNLDSLVVLIDSIAIKTENSIQFFSSESQVKSFFRDRLINDRYKAKIIIELK